MKVMDLRGLRAQTLKGIATPFAIPTNTNLTAEYRSVVFDGEVPVGASGGSAVYQ